MIAYLLKLLSRHDDVLLEQVESYLLLTSIELKQYRNQLISRIVSAIVCLLLVTCAVIVAGVGVLLWAVEHQQWWMVWLLPSLLIFAAFLLRWVTTSTQSNPAFDLVKSQIRQDISLLKHHASRSTST